MQPEIIHRDEHSVSRKHFSEAARKVLYRLNTKGYIGYLAGGAVRDILLDRDPKDFDVVTDARPNQIRKVFRNSRMIGRRFRLAHIYFHDEIIECATFRRQIDSEQESKVKDKHFSRDGGMVVRDNVYGTPEEDALRRDFTVNALFYNIEDYSVIDYVDGLRDIDARLIRSIGDPRVRYTEDPVRMIRALRFAAKLDFTIEEETYAAIKDKSDLIANASPARMYEEIQKLFFCGNSESVFEYLEDTGLFEAILPDLAAFVAAGADERKWILRVVRQLDKWCAAGKEIRPDIFFGLLLGPYIASRADLFKGGDLFARLKNSAQDALNGMRDRIVIPKNVKHSVADIVGGQPRLTRAPKGKKAQGYARKRGFTEALIYFKLRARHSGRNLREAEQWQKLLKS